MRAITFRENDVVVKPEGEHLSEEERLRQQVRSLLHENEKLRLRLEPLDNPGHYRDSCECQNCRTFRRWNYPIYLNRELE